MPLSECAFDPIATVGECLEFDIGVAGELAVAGCLAEPVLLVLIKLALEVDG